MQEASCVSVFAVENSGSHYAAMQYPTVLREMMRVGELTQAELARTLRVKQPTISRILRGAEPKGALHERIMREAGRLGVISDGSPEPAAAPTRPIGVQMVRVVGYVGAGAQAHFYAVSQGDLDEVPAPPYSTDATVAVEIRGDSL